MANDAAQSELFDLMSEIQLEDGVCFDPDGITLHGLYSDELSAHRAKRVWIATLDESFFLEPELDFAVKVASDTTRGKFILTCQFVSASARYAFWRLTHAQAPEAQYTIETAHVPNAESQSSRFLSAPDLEDFSSREYSPLDDLDFKTGLETQSLLERLVKKIKKIIR